MQKKLYLLLCYYVTSLLLLKAQEYLPNRFVAKLLPTFRYELEQNVHLQQYLQQEGVKKWSKKFPRHSPLEKENNRFGEPLVDLTLIYDFEAYPDVDISRLTQRLQSFAMFEYAEPYYAHEPFFTPNDPMIVSNASQHWWLANVNAYNAWDIQTGNPSVIIGIIDTGSDLDHPDLTPNLYLNTADPINGIDDDGNGYTDDYQGWDFVGGNSAAPNADNNPNIVTGGNAHGSWVTSFAAASTNNGIGVPSAGFNCKFMPIKIMADNGGPLYFGYDAIIYAADNGCKIINCSWGGIYFSHYGQDAVNYATNNKDVLVVAAAGNTNADICYYPAAMQNVLSVTGNRTGDIFSQTTRNYSVDMMAPARSIRFAGFNNTYGSFAADYTSFSAPIVSGAAGLVRSQFPTLNAQQVAERLRVTADDTYSINTNPAWKGKIGRGRLNMYRALSETTPAIRSITKTLEDGNDNFITDTDVVQYKATFKNFLDPDNITVTLSTDDPNISIISNFTNLGNINTLATANNNSSPFIFQCNTSLPNDYVIYFRLTYSNGSSYTDFQYDSVIVNSTWMDITINQTLTTTGSEGAFAYKNFPINSIGYGLTFNNNQLLFEGGLLVGISGSQLSDNVRNLTFTRDGDFQIVQPIRPVSPPIFSQMETVSSMQDFKPNKLDIFVRTQTYAWNNPTDNQFIIYEYQIKNIGTSTLNNLFAGWYLDWDIPNNLNQNIGVFDSSLNLLYTKNTANNLFGGMVLLTFDSTHALSTTLPMNFSPSETNKFNSISGGTASANTLFATEVQQFMGTGPLTIPQNDSIFVAFAILAASTEVELKNMAQKAHEYYRCILHAADPRISFAATSLNHTEMTSTSINCQNYHDLVIPIAIDKAPNYSAQIHVQIDPATTAIPAQYQILNPILAFPQGSNASQNLIVRVFDDNYDYGTRQIVLSMKLKNYKDAILDCGNQKFTINLTDNDAPVTSAPVETNLSSNTQPLGPYGTAYFFNGTNILARIDNLTSHDYGCVQLDIDRAGTGAIPFQSPIPSRRASQKTFFVTPEFNDPAGIYDITLYFAQAEIEGWETATGNSRTQATIFKSSQPIMNVSPIGNYYATNLISGTWNTNDFYIKGRFNTGFSGFAIGKEEPDGPLPIANLQLFHKFLTPQSLQLHWLYTADQPANSYKLFLLHPNHKQLLLQTPEIQPFQFSILPNQQKHLTFVIEAYDLDGNILAMDVEEVALEQIPFSLTFDPLQQTLTLYNHLKRPISLYNTLGQRLQIYSPPSEEPFSFSIHNLPKGIYFIQNEITTLKFVIP